MFLKRLLQINMAVLAALGTLLLSMGQQDPTLPMVMIVAAASSVWLTDVTGWFRLNRMVANLVALAALVLVMADLGSLRGMTQLLFISRLLVYLQIVLLFQEKDTRAYWQLATVSLLQVVVAAAFNQGFWFGVMLILYLLTGLSALALFYLHRERLAHERAGEAHAEPAPRGRRWPLAAQPAVFTAAAGPAAAGLDGELFRRLGAMGAGTLALTVVLFFTVPRVGGSAWRGAMVAPRHAVGFSDRVRLGELGEIIQKPQEVMRVRFTDRDRQTYRVQGDIYLRGAVLNHYSQGDWRFSPARIRARVAPLEPTNLLTHEGLVRQEITIEPMDCEQLFCVWPFAKTEVGGELLFDRARRQLRRPPELAPKRFAYELMTSALVDGSQVPLTPAEDLFPTASLLQMPLSDGRSAVPSLVELAEQWVRESERSPRDRLSLARMLENRLRTSKRFQYSLQGQNRDPTVDPLEDFIANNPRGHCEYFASALVLMLRSQGIPARLVVGYHCDEWNNLGQFYQVRQWHAHTWVEAYLPPRQVPEHLFHGEQHREWAAGAWVRLDPTPGGSESDAAASPSWSQRVVRSLSWFDALWTNYVMEMDRPRQQEAIYRPVAESLQRLGEQLSDPAWWWGLVAGLGSVVRTAFASWVGGNWFSWRGFVVVFVLGLIVMGLGRLVQIVIHRIARRLAESRRIAGAGRRPRVEFYQRLETLLARRGLHRRSGQTPWEFAAEAGPVLAAEEGSEDLAELPRRVAAAFYRVRFGGVALDSREAQEVERWLEALQQTGRRP